MNKKMLENQTNNDKGSIMILVALMMTVLLACCALAIDVSMAYVEKAKLQNAVDAASLAGAQELPNTTSALTVANQYIVLNGFSPSDISVSFSNGNKTISVTGTKTFNYIFAKVIGFNTGTLSATAAAAVSPVGSVSGVVPLGVEEQTFVYGQTYTLKNGGGSGYTGNYGALALGGTGASVFKNNLEDGYSGTLTVGQSVDTEPGNMKGPTDTGVSYRINKDPTATFSTVQKGSPRIVVVPVMDTMKVNGRKPVTIVGFAVFFIESCSDGVITGDFMQMVVNNSTSGTGTDFGAYKLKLTK
ncbi:MAG: hypothetical protein GX434_17995 [Peptococcaceae bacterium]|nr:hypothetical protein [Peptococcaceae bacterium]